MSKLMLELVGCFGAWTGTGAAVSFPTKKAKALLAYLAAHPGAYHARSSLAALLWCDRGERQARGSLRQTLTYLRKALGPMGLQPLVVREDCVGIDPTSVTVDAAMLESLAAQGSPEALQAAGDLYRGEFLEGFDLREEPFNDWLRAERARLRELALQALKTLLAIHMAQGQLSRGLTVANRLLAMDPLQEQVHRSLIELHLRRGERALAVRQYQTCREILLRELGIEPDDETRRIWRCACGAAAIEAEALKSPTPMRGNKPSIAVLPFESAAGGTDLCDLADRVTEEIIEGLSRVGWLFVNAHRFPPEIIGLWPLPSRPGEWPECRYLLKGKVRRVANRVRVMVRLIDTANDLHIWVEHFDRHASEVHDLQDPLSAYVIGAIEPRLRIAELRRAKLKPLDDLEPYDLVVRAMPHLSNVCREDSIVARRYLARAIEIDPQYAPALAHAAWCNGFSKLFGWSGDLETDVGEGLRLAERAIDSHPHDPAVLRATAMATVILEGDQERALRLADKALSIEPTSALGWAIRGWINIWDERIDPAYADFQRAQRLSPSDSWSFLTTLGLANTLTKKGHAEEGLPWARRTCADRPFWSAAYRNLIFCLVYADQLEAAKSTVKPLLELEPGLTVSGQFAKGQYRGGAYFDRFAEALRRAGLPE